METTTADRLTAPITNPNLLEKTLISEILSHLAYLLLAESPNKSKVKEAADRYRGQLLASLNEEQRKPFLQTRDIVVELARLLARCQSQEQLGKTLSYLKSLSQGEVMIVDDQANDQTMRQKLADHLEYLYGFQARPDELDQLINITRNLSHA